MKRAYLSLGSNMGDREQYLQQAIDALHGPALRITRISPVYETEPAEVRNQRWFLNLAVEAETDLFPLQLLSRTSRVERELGRKRMTPKGPRTIDIDIILFGNFIIDLPQLTVPHPRFRERRFVLAPLADLAPGLRDPVTRKTVRELLTAVSAQTVRRVAFTPALIS